jgi:ParB-like chromosome segregation protein Spo0J
MTALRESLRARGQQTPVELVDLGAAGYGLISGWRRVTALEQLHAETGEARFGVVQALLRTPATAEAAYTSMVEENEIRVGLSPYERARIVAKSVEQGVFPTHRQALQSLFATASRAKRSKIGSFLSVVAALDGVLRFPGALTERLGLRLAKALEQSHDLGRDLRVRLRKAGSITDAASEAAWLEAALARAATKPSQAQANPPSRGDTGAPGPASRPPAPERSESDEIVRGISLQQGEENGHRRVILSGPGVDAAFRDRLIAWLRDQA